jgi:hypothetical protein
LSPPSQVPFTTFFRDAKYFSTDCSRAHLVDLSPGTGIFEDGCSTAICILHIHPVRLLYLYLGHAYSYFIHRVESGVIYSASVLTYLILGAIPSVSIVQEPVLAVLAQVVVCHVFDAATE